MTTEVIQYGVDGGGKRSAAFSAGGLQVLVSPLDEELNGTALALARSLADSTNALATLESRVSSCREEAESTARALRSRIADLQQKVPPARGAQLLGAGYVRFTDAGELWILSGREKGWGHFGYRCEDWDDLFRRWNVRVTGAGADECGPWWSVENAAPAAEGSAS